MSVGMDPRPPPEPAPPPDVGQAPQCTDCGAALPGRYCAACGQDSAVRLDRPLRALAAETISETLSLDGRVARTMAALLARPGAVAAEYAAGRRTRYTSPLRLYLAASLLFFVASTAGPGAPVRLRIGSPGDGATASAARAERERALAGVAEATAPLRGLGTPGRVLADRIEALAALPPAEAQRRFDVAFAENGPRVLFFLVPLLALYLRVLYPRRFYAEHLVLALHVQTVGYLTLLPGELTRWPPLVLAGVLAAFAWTALAIRRIGGDGWRRTAPKLAVLTVAFGMSWSLLVAALALVALLAT